MSIDLAIDLGTKNIVIMHNDKVLIDDEAIVALRFDKDAPPRLVGVGNGMRGVSWHGGHDIRLVRPFQNGKIEDEHAFRLMYEAFLRKAVYLARPRWQRFFIDLREAFREAPVLWLYLAIFLAVILIICL